MATFYCALLFCFMLQLLAWRLTWEKSILKIVREIFLRPDILIGYLKYVRGITEKLANGN